MSKYRYLIFAEKEALLRFPNEVQAIYWKWDLCHNLAIFYQSVATDAPELSCYSKLIEDGLNSGQVDLENLKNWFSSHEGRFSFEITSFDPPPGYTSSHVISLENNANLLLFEKNGNFRVSGLMSSMFHYRESGSKFQLLDLTGDDYPELVLYFGYSHCCGVWSTQFVYDLYSGEPRQLVFENTYGLSFFLPSEYESFITPLAPSTEQPGFLFKSRYYGDPLVHSCDLRKYEKYYWVNGQFEVMETWLGIEEPDEYDDIELCRFVLDIVQDQDEMDVAVKTIGDVRIGDPDVTRDQILYRLGEYYARLGAVTKSKQFFEKAIQTDEGTSASPWTQAAQTFLDHYQDKSDFYVVCSQIIQCNMRDSFRQFVSEIEPKDFLLAFELLKSTEIQIKSNGFVDLDSDGQYEQWFVIQHPRENYREFWVLVEDSEKIYGLFVSEIPANQPELNQFRGTNFYELTVVNGKSLISLEKIGFSNQPYILVHDSIQDENPLTENTFLRHNLFDAEINNIADQLFTGTDPAEIRNMLTRLSQSQTFTCENHNFTCDQLYYLLGLTYELTGEKQKAVDYYLRLWGEHPYSFYTIMVRSKLELHQ